jgi:hypothetical protein
MSSSNPPQEFQKLIDDLVNDILITFPEYNGIISRWWNRKITEGKTTEDKEECRRKEILFVFRHCVKVYPERFFDLLYKNVEIFDEDSDINTEFLPGIVFKQLWHLDISDNTKETIWKYLQLILFSVMGTVNNSEQLGENTAKMFEAINEEELKQKLEETLEGMQNMFDSSYNGEQGIPNAQDIHERIHSMMGGKLGKLAMELAEETARDLNLDVENNGDAKDVFQKLFKNPTKMMNMVKNIGSKLDEKIKSGEIKESELMEEGMELLNQMKSMPGMGDMQKMFSQMGIPGLGKNAKLNMGAMEAQLNRNMRTAKMKERMKARVEAKEKQNSIQNQSSNNSKPLYSEEELIKMFSKSDTNTHSNPNKKKNKKK